jgi:thiamine transport system ATP-binding protein
MLTIDRVTVSYPAGRKSVIAVDDVCLELPDGAVLALLGPSGCGKSTLLRAVAGLEPLATGRICWDDVDLATVAVHRRHFGLMFQDGVLFPHRTVAGNIGYGLPFTGMNRAAQRRRIGELLELVGLPGMGTRRVGSLSGGQQQRVALARALAPSPRLLLLDEPLAALDAELRSRLLTDLRTVLAETRSTALFVTHDQGEAFAVADRIALMQAGRIRQTGTPTQLWRNPRDGWVAGFVGYTTVLPAGHQVAGIGPGPIALRPAALVADPAGPLTGTVLAARPTPDTVRLTVQLTGSDPVQAISDTVPTVGAVVRLRLDAAGTASLPPGGTVPSDGTVLSDGTVDQ